AAQDLVQSVPQRHLALDQASALDDGHDERVRGDSVFIVLLLLLIATFETGGEEVGGVRAYLAAEEVKRVAEPVVDVALDDVERDASRSAHVFVRVLFHQLRCAADYPTDAGLADEEVVRLFRQHELARARERLEARFGERRELVLAVAVCEHREAEKVEPVVAGLVEGFEYSRLVGVPRTTFEQGVGLVAPVATEVALKNVDHRPEVSALLDVHLKQIPKVVE